MIARKLTRNLYTGFEGYLGGFEFQGVFSATISWQAQRAYMSRMHSLPVILQRYSGISSAGGSSSGSSKMSWHIL